MGEKMNKNNLIPLTNRDEEEARKIQVAGGKASGVARKRKSNIKKMINDLLSNKIKVDEDFEELYTKLGMEISYDNNVAQLLTASLIYKAVSGDVAAVKYVMEIIGQDPMLMLKKQEIALKQRTNKDNNTNEEVDPLSKALNDIAGE